MSLPHEITTEEYTANFNSEPLKGYPKKLKFKNKTFNLILKEFEYEDKKFLKAEIWDEEMEQLFIILTLIKTENARFHSPSNSWFDIEPSIIGTDEGIFMLKEIMKKIKNKIAFIVEDIYPEDIMYNALNKTYDEERYEKTKKYYEKSGLEFKFNKENGKGFIIYKDKKMNENEKKLFKQFTSE
jgi:hypothetical protein